MFIIIYLCLLIRVAFITLLERKYLGYVHLRKGPNKVAFIGLGQPFADAGKLFFKEFIILNKISGLIYYLAPFCILFIILCIWLRFPFFLFDFRLRIFYFFCCVAVGIYPLIIAG